MSLSGTSSSNIYRFFVSTFFIRFFILSFSLRTKKLLKSIWLSWKSFEL